MTKDTYWQLLRRPEWQRKRLEIMQAADFRCESCDAADRTLNVHHKYYRNGKKPWEYPDDALECLCEECHKRKHALRDELRSLAGVLSDADVSRVLGYTRGLFLQATASPTDDRKTENLAWVESWEHAAGLADSYSIRGYDGVLRILASGIGPNGELVSHAILSNLARSQAAGSPTT